MFCLVRDLQKCQHLQRPYRHVNEAALVNQQALVQMEIAEMGSWPEKIPRWYVHL